MPTAGPTVRRLAVVGLVGPVVFWAIVAVLGFITPGYQPTDDYVSTLGAVGAPYALVQQLNFVIFGGAFISLAMGLHRWFGDGRRPRLSTLFLVVCGLAFLLAGLVQSDPAAPTSTTNVLHDVLGLIAFMTSLGAVGLVTRRLETASTWPTYRFETVVAVAVVVVMFGAFMLLLDSPGVGLTQRLFLGALSLWVIVQSYRLYRLTGSASMTRS